MLVKHVIQRNDSVGDLIKSNITTHWQHRKMDGWKYMWKDSRVRAIGVYIIMVECVRGAAT